MWGQKSDIKLFQFEDLLSMEIPDLAPISICDGGVWEDDCRHTLCSQNRSISLFADSSLVNGGSLDEREDVTELLQDIFQG